MQVEIHDARQDLSCNPYAPEFMLGLDAETPEGFEDRYGEYAVSGTLIASQVLGIQMYFPVDFIIRGLKSNSNLSGGNTLPEYFIRLRDVDGSFLSNAPVAAQLMFGSGMFPTPWLDWFIPAGFYIGIEVIASSAGGGNFQLVFAGVERRRKFGD